MQITDFTTSNGNRGQLQKLRRLLVIAVSQSMNNAAKNAWLSALIGVAVVDVTADESLSRSALDSDSKSNNTCPGLIQALERACSEASMYGGDYKTQLIADLNEADAILTA